MKIVLFIDSLCAGGAQRQLVGLAKLLKEKGIDTEVLTYHKDEFYLPFLEKNNVKYCYLKNAENKYRRIFVITNYLKRCKPDVVISYLSTPNIIACFSKLLGLKSKLIVSERYTSQRIGKSEKRRFFMYRLANKIVPNSYSQESFIKKNYPHLYNKVKTITNFVDTNYFIPKTKGEKNNIPTIISVGRINPQKNILNYLRALKIIADKGFSFKVVWYGNTDKKNYYEECKSLIKELSLERYFEFKSATKSIINEYQNADIFCLPSLFEGFPNVLCEAMSCGLPVVCSDVCDNAQIAINEKSGYLFDPINADNIADAIEKILTQSNAELSKIGIYNRNRAIACFSEENFVTKYIDIII